MFNLFDLSLKINGFPMKEANREFNKILKLSENEFEKHIIEKRDSILNFHLKHNHSYQDFTKNIQINNWHDVPVMTKKNYQRPLIERLSDGYTIKSVYVNKTSGSSGDPFVYAKDKFCHAITWSNVNYRFGWYHINFNHSFQARFYGIPLELIGNIKERFKDFLSSRYRFAIFDLSDSILEKVLLKFKSKKFEYINGYTSSILLFAKFLHQKNIILKDVCPTLNVCIVTSEMLFPEDKLFMEKQFGIPVVNEYGASELGLIAFQNPLDEWQICSEILYVEILDENNKSVPNGQPGRIVITSLYNQAHPFIRYDIGDIGVLDPKSTLKKPILKELIGRTNDIAILPSGKKSPGLTFYYVTKSIIADDGNVKEFIVKQTALDSFDIEYVSEVELTPEQISKMKSAITLYLEPGLNFNFNRMNVLERGKNGKLKQFISLIS